jgi:hypothetical protein
MAGSGDVPAAFRADSDGKPNPRRVSRIDSKLSGAM